MVELEQLKLRIAQLEEQLEKQDLQHRSERTFLRQESLYQQALVHNAVTEQFSEDLSLILCMLDRPNPKIPQAIYRVESLQIVAADLLKKSAVGFADRYK